MTAGHWRQGSRVPHHVYHQVGDEPNYEPWPRGDPLVATFFEPADADLACRAVNELKDREGDG